MPEIDISIVIPLYNEEESINPLYDSIARVLKGLNKSYEIIFVDDGSSDATLLRAKAIQQNDLHLKVIKFRRNYGQTSAMQAGFDNANGRIIVSMDGDLQNDPEDIPRFLEKIEEGYDIVCGWRKNRKDKLITRKIPSKIANWLIGRITGVMIHDNGCSLKAYKSTVIKKTRLYSDMHRFIPAIISIGGARYTEIVVNHHARKFGSSKYGLSRTWKVFLDIFMIKMLMGFSVLHGFWFVILSVPFFLVGTISTFISINLYRTSQNYSSFPIIFPSVSVLSFFLFVHLILLGFLSEMIYRVGDFKPKNFKRTSSVEVS